MNIAQFLRLILGSRVDDKRLKFTLFAGNIICQLIGDCWEFLCFDDL